MGNGFDIMHLLPIVLIVAIFYVLILRPQQQKLKRHQGMLANLRRGDRVVTNGGLIGTVSKIVSDTEVQLELAEDIRVRHVRGMIAEVLAKPDPVAAHETSRGSTTNDMGEPSPSTKKTSVPKAKRTVSKPANRPTGKAKV